MQHPIDVLWQPMETHATILVLACNSGWQYLARGTKQWFVFDQAFFHGVNNQSPSYQLLVVSEHDE